MVEKEILKKDIKFMGVLWNMEIKISKDKDTVYFQVDSKNKEIMSFDALVKLAESIIHEGVVSPDDVIVSSNDSALDLYKQTIDEIVSSIITDKDLIELLDKQEPSEDDLFGFGDIGF